MEWVTPVLSVVGGFITAVGGVILAGKKFGADRANTGYDQVQEDLKEIRADNKTQREEVTYLGALVRHLENELTTVREAWPPGFPLPAREPYPTRSAVQ